MTDTPRTLPSMPAATAETPTPLTPPQGAETEAKPATPRLEPTRYGDWELNGKCVDF